MSISSLEDKWGLGTGGGLEVKSSYDPKYSIWKHSVNFDFRVRENNLRPRGDETICQQRPTAVKFTSRKQ
jgi:hypothetical protein